MNPTDSITIAECARRLGVKDMTVRRWIDLGVTVRGRRVKFGAVRIGGRFRISPDAIERFHAECNPEATPIPESVTHAAARMSRERNHALSLLGATQ